jgi:hypothetical protein
MTILDFQYPLLAKLPRSIARVHTTVRIDFIGSHF